MMCEDNIILSVIVQAPYTHVPLHWKNYIRDVIIKPVVLHI